MTKTETGLFNIALDFDGTIWQLIFSLFLK